MFLSCLVRLAGPAERSPLQCGIPDEMAGGWLQLETGQSIHRFPKSGFTRKIPPNTGMRANCYGTTMPLMR